MATFPSYMTAEEAAALIQMVGLKYLKSNESEVLLPPPDPEQMTGDFLLGQIQYGSRPRGFLYLRRENFIKHIGIFSITGGGKTNVAQNLLLGLLEKEIPFLVVDWKRSYHALRSLNHSKVDCLQVYSVGRKTGNDFHWNPLRGPPGVHPKTWISTVAEVLEKSHISGPGVADVFIELFDKKFEEMGVYDGKHSMLPNFFGPPTRLHLGFLIFAIVVVALQKSTLMLPVFFASFALAGVGMALSFYADHLAFRRTRKPAEEGAL